MFINSNPCLISSVITSDRFCNFPLFLMKLYSAACPISAEYPHSITAVSCREGKAFLFERFLVILYYTYVFLQCFLYFRIRSFFMSQKYLCNISKETVSRYLLFFSSYIQLFALPHTKAWNTCRFFSTIDCVFGSTIKSPQLDGENLCYRLLYLVLVQIFLVIKLQ